MNAKILNSLAILCLIVVIGVMSWRDMHPKIEADALSPSLGIVAYYAGPDVTPAMIPDDSKPITIGVGEFSYTSDDKLSWTPHGMPPTTIAQRQVNLQFNFKSLPKNPDETIKKITSLAEDWKHKGDTVTTLVLDYSPAKADLKAYAVLLGAAHGAFKGSYVIYTGINILWTDGPQKEALKELQDTSPQFLIHLPQAHISPELLSKLAALKYNLVLQYPAGTQMADLDMAALKKIPSLTGVTLTLDAHRPLPKKEEKIGLFPKL